MALSEVLAKRPIQEHLEGLGSGLWTMAFSSRPLSNKPHYSLVKSQYLHTLSHCTAGNCSQRGLSFASISGVHL
jgi:hypothetical protein